TIILGSAALPAIRRSGAPAPGTAPKRPAARRPENAAPPQSARAEPPRPRKVAASFTTPGRAAQHDYQTMTTPLRPGRPQRPAGGAGQAVRPARPLARPAASTRPTRSCPRRAGPLRRPIRTHALARPPPRVAGRRPARRVPAVVGAWLWRLCVHPGGHPDGR